MTVLSAPQSGSPQSEVVARAVELLKEGRLVALPTETVYGLAARADDAGALDRLAALVGVGDRRTFTWHVAGAPDLRGGGFELPGVLERLAARYWPGPLTLVVRGAGEAVAEVTSGGWTGVRVPSHDATRAILDAAPFPVVMAAAMRPGDRPALEAPVLREAFAEDEVDLVVDGGPSSLGEPSTVVAVGRGRFEIVREGIVAGDDLARTAGLQLLFVCTGNTCRSPMAEALARATLRRELGTRDEGTFGFDVASAGVYAGPGAPASPEAVDVLRERGIDLTAHLSSPAIDREVVARDRVYCMTASHRDALLAMLPPGAAARVELLDPDGADVPDPFGGSHDVYRQTANAIEGFVEARLGEWI